MSWYPLRRTILAAVSLSLMLSACVPAEPIAFTGSSQPSSETPSQASTAASSVNTPQTSSTAPSLPFASSSGLIPSQSQTTVSGQISLESGAAPSEAPIKERLNLPNPVPLGEEQLPEGPIVSVFVGLDSAVITQEGKLYIWGNNSHGSRGDGTIQKPAERILPPFCQTGIPDPVIDAQMGYGSYALTETGDIYLWGEEYRVGVDIERMDPGESILRPTRFSFPQPVKQVADGTLFLLEDGSVWHLGNFPDWIDGHQRFFYRIPSESGLYGESNYTPLDLPEALEEIPLDFPCKQIGVYSNYYTFLSEDGTVYIFGTLGMDASCGFSFYYYGEPKALPFPEPIQDVQGTGFHLFALSESGKLYVYGDPNFTFYDPPQTIMGAISPEDACLGERLYLKNLPEPLTQIAVSTYSYLALGESGTLYQWGACTPDYIINEQWNRDYQPIPTAIIPPEPVIDIFCSSIYAILTENSSIYQWGDNTRQRIPGAPEEFLTEPFKLTWQW